MVATQKQIGFLLNDGSMLTTSEVARRLGAHINSVRHWADIGLLPCYRIGVRKDRRFRSEDVAVFLGSPDKN